MALVWLATEAAPGARGFCFSGSREQAAILIDSASGLVDRTPELRGTIVVQSQKLIATSTGATVEVRAADGDTAWGLLPSFLVVDELAQWQETRRARKLWVAITSSLAKVPGCRFVCLTSAGSPGHWSYRVLKDALNAPDRWHVHEVPGPLPWVDEADLKAQGLRDSEYLRLHLNVWSQSEDHLVSEEDLEAAAVLEGEQEPRPGVQYVMSVDLGLVHDRTVVAVGHAEPTSDEAGAPRRVVVDSLKRWRGKRLRPVQLSDVEAYIALTARRYSNAKVIFDPWQAAGLSQRLQTQGIRCEAFNFTQTSTARLASSLHLALKNRLVWLPNDDELLTELAHIRLRENGIGQVRLDHDADGHDDMAVTVAMIVNELIANQKTSGLAAFFEREHPIHSCGMPNPRSSTKCSKCGEVLEPPPETELSSEEMAAVAQCVGSSERPRELPGEAAVHRNVALIAQMRKQDAVIDFGPMFGRGR